jgi:hypothetical protein
MSISSGSDESEWKTISKKKDKGTKLNYKKDKIYKKSPPSRDDVSEWKTILKKTEGKKVNHKKDKIYKKTPPARDDRCSESCRKIINASHERVCYNKVASNGDAVSCNRL